MGNCGSSLNCDQYFDVQPCRNCTSEIKADADIAGIGVLIAFYFSAWLLSIVVIWGWCKKSLPSNLHTPTDYHTVQLWKRRRTPFGEADVQREQTPAQKKTAGTVTGFTKILGDQQLVSGIAILSAGLASRCTISLYEFNIVTCLAYLCTFTHLLSLNIMREYLYKHTFVRGWRVASTIGFFLLFCFSYIVNSANYDVDFGEPSSLNSGNVLQCVFEAPKFNKTVRFHTYYSVTLLLVLAYQHAFAIGDLFLHPETDTPNKIVETIISWSLRKTGMSQEERQEIVANSSAKYDAWIRPPRDADESTEISIWFYLEAYFDTAMSDIPRILAGMAYGTVSTVRAVWGNNLDISGLNEFGFGQIVAVGLLLLMVLAGVEVFNEQRLIARKEPSARSREGSAAQVEMSELEPLTRDNQVSLHGSPPPNGLNIALDIEQNGSFQERFVLYGVPKEKKQLHDLAALQSAPDDYYDNPVIARRTAKAASGIWIFHACLYTYAGLAWDFAEVEDSVVVLLVLWRSFQILLSIKRIVNQTYFVKVETNLRTKSKNKPTSGSQQQLVVACQSPAGSSVASMQPSTTRSPSLPDPPSPPLQPESSSIGTSSSSMPRRDLGHDSSVVSPVQDGLTYRGSFPFPETQ